MKKILQFLLQRARERSTWLGLVSCVTALGIVLSPEQIEAIVATGMAAIGLIAAFTVDKT